MCSSNFLQFDKTENKRRGANGTQKKKKLNHSGSCLWIMGDMAWHGIWQGAQLSLRKKPICSKKQNTQKLLCGKTKRMICHAERLINCAKKIRKIEAMNLPGRTHVAIAGRMQEFCKEKNKYIYNQI